MEAVLDAVHQLFVEGQPDPSAEEVAARSGVSLRSIYRYFPDREQLLVAALRRRLDESAHLYRSEGIGTGSFDDRVEAFVTQRLDVHDLMAPTARATLVAMRHMPRLAEMVNDRRRQLQEVARAQFAPELDALPADQRERAATALGVLCQFESVESLRSEQELGRAETAAVLAAGVRALLQRPVTDD